uniref:Parathyroid hormone n=1 Tax=Sphaeramia orbicularis TaxID=375764 RepID=A0A673CPK7_9TELE
VVSCRCLSPSINLSLVNLFFHLSSRRRAISEVQLMHNVQQHKQVGGRQDWLEETLKDIIVPTVKPQEGRSETIKNLFSNVFGSEKS